MSEFITAIQDDIVARAKALDDSWSARDLRPALRTLRRQHSSPESPDYSTSDARLAYALAYHPFHALMSYEVFCQFRDLLPCRDGRVFTAVILGAGPGAEAVALVRILSEISEPPSTIRLRLLDREPGWERTRAVTLEVTARRWFSGNLEIEHVTADLSTPEGRRIVREAMSDVDLVTAQAVVSEIPDQDDATSFMADLVTTFPSEALLLMSDMTGNQKLDAVVNDLDAHPSLRTVQAVRQTYPMPVSTSEARDLFADEDGLRQRRRVMVTARLFSRPEWRPDQVRVDEEFDPTPDQAAALAAFERFVADRTGDIFILEGPAGSGKTEIMRRMASISSKFGLVTSLMAPTGQAAVRLSQRTGLATSTIHSGLYDRTQVIDNDSNERDWPPTTVFAPQTVGGPGHIWIIDEASMVGDDPDEAQDTAEPPELKFGDGRLLSDILSNTVALGGQVVFVGDSCQLPPFKADRSLALSANDLSSRGHRVVSVSLTSLVRTAHNSEITEFSRSLREHVREGQLGLLDFTPDGTREVAELPTFALEDYLLTRFASGSAVALAKRNSDVATWNTNIRVQMGRTGVLPEASERLVLSKGSHTLGLLNGSEIRVVELLGEQVTRRVTVRDKGGPVSLEVHLQNALLSVTTASGMSLEFEAPIVVNLLTAPSPDIIRRVRQALWVDFVMRLRKEMVVSKAEILERYEHDAIVNAIHASYGYARTIFRAQGGEWESVVIDGHSLFKIEHTSSRHAYSAVTRAKKALYLRNWPQGDERWTERRLAHGALSAMQRELSRRVAYQRINENNTTLAIQVRTDDSMPAVFVNVFERVSGDVNFSVQKSAGAEIPKSLIQSLEYWCALENSRQRTAAPLPIASSMSMIELHFFPLGIDVFVRPTGNFEAEVSLFREPHEWASLRIFFKGDGSVTKCFHGKGSERLRRQLVEQLLEKWPSIKGAGDI